MGTFECDDVTRRAHVSRKRAQQATASAVISGLPRREATDGVLRPPPEKALLRGTTKQSLRILEQILGRKRFPGCSLCTHPPATAGSDDRTVTNSAILAPLICPGAPPTCTGMLFIVKEASGATVCTFGHKQTNKQQMEEWQRQRQHQRHSSLPPTAPLHPSLYTVPVCVCARARICLPVSHSWIPVGYAVYVRARARARARRCGPPVVLRFSQRTRLPDVALAGILIAVVDKTLVAALTASSLVMIPLERV